MSRELHSIVQQVLITFAVLQTLEASSYATNFLKAMLVSRLYTLSHANPCELVLEELVALIITGFKLSTTGETLIYWGPVFFVVHRACRNAARRLQIWPYALVKMLTVKKQRVRNYPLILAAQVLLLPVSLAFLGVLMR